MSGAVILSSGAARQIAPGRYVGGQITPEDMAALQAGGIGLIICARPDGEDPGQPDFALLARAAHAAGLRALHVPVTDYLDGAMLAQVAGALAPGLAVYGFCRSGARAEALLLHAQPGGA